MAIKHTTLVQRLADDAPNELEECEMIVVDHTERIWVESSPIRSNWVEQCVARIEHLAGHGTEPFSRYTTGINPFFSYEADVELAVFDFGTSLVV